MQKISGSNTSVFAGNGLDDFRSMYAKDPEQGSIYSLTGTSDPLLANRISWFFNLKGPSLCIDTACSSSASALHLACQNLLLHESNMV